MVNIHSNSLKYSGIIITLPCELGYCDLIYVIMLLCVLKLHASLYKLFQFRKYAGEATLYT